MLAKNFTSVYIAAALDTIAGHDQPTQRMARDEWDPSEKRTQASQAGEVMGVGIQFAGSIVVFLLAGRWLDIWLGTTPWLLILGVFVGAGAGFYSMYRQLVIKPRERQERHKREREQR